MELALAEQMRKLDNAAIHEFGIPGIVLMENAGRKTCDGLIGRYGNPAGKRAVIFAGPGNNGGDGFVVARHLHQHRAEVVIYLLVDPDSVTGDAKTNLDIVQKLAIPIHTVTSTDSISEIELSSADFIIDGLFGTGLKRDIEGHFALAVDAMNSCSVPVVALDIPSGLHSDTGHPLGRCVSADATYTYGLLKPGQICYPGKKFCGYLEIIDIGIPPEAVDSAQLHLEVLDDKSISAMLQSRLPEGHKGTHGHMLVIGGSVGKTGAVILTAKGGLRSGSGLVSVCSPRQVNVIYESALHEAMTIPVEGTESGAPSIRDYAVIHDAISGKKAVVVGPGSGLDASTTELMHKLYKECELPMVVDADALNSLASQPSSIECDKEHVRILTPHPGEMARLTGMTVEQIQSDRITIARDFSMKNNVYLVLKGASTVVSGPDGRVALNSTGNPGMGAGGMGDVLSGLIGGLLAQGLEPWSAACVSVYCHGMAADRLYQKMNQGYLATEVAEVFPEVITRLNK